MVKEEYRQRLILERLERPEDIAGAVAFLCSPAADQITASHLIVSGGLAVSPLGLPFTTGAGRNPPGTDFRAG